MDRNVVADQAYDMGRFVHYEDSVLSLYFGKTKRWSGLVDEALSLTPMLYAF